MTVQQMLQDNTDYGDAWTSLQLAEAALAEGDAAAAADFAAIHAHVYGADSLPAALAELV